MQTSTHLQEQQACVECDRILPIEHFPLARPRADGSRHPMRHCAECLEQAAFRRMEARAQPYTFAWCVQENVYRGRCECGKC